MSESLELVCPKPDLVVDDVIVGRTNCSLKTIMRLKEEIELCPLFVSHHVNPVQMLTHRKRP